MKGDVVPDVHHVSRLCGGSHIRTDGRIAGSAFKLRPGEAYLSVNWLEALDLSARDAELAEVRRVLATKRTIGATARLAILNVGRGREVVRQASEGRRNLDVLHEPETEPGRPQDPSHSGIYGVSGEDNITQQILADNVQEIYQAR